VQKRRVFFACSDDSAKRRLDIFFSAALSVKVLALTYVVVKSHILFFFFFFSLRIVGKGADADICGGWDARPL